MERRHWDAATKAKIVIEGLQGKPVAQILSDHKLCENLYYRWRAQFLANVSRVFTRNSEPIQQTTQLEAENRQLKQLIGEMTIESRQLQG